MFAVNCVCAIAGTASAAAKPRDRKSRDFIDTLEVGGDSGRARRSGAIPVRTRRTRALAIVIELRQPSGGLPQAAATPAVRQILTPRIIAGAEIRSRPNKSVVACPLEPAGRRKSGSRGD